MIKTYDSFIDEKRFDSVLDEMFMMFESEGWIDKNTYEWNDMDDRSGLEKTKEKLKSFLKNLSLNEVKKYFKIFLKKIENFPEDKRKMALIIVGSVFLSFAPVTILVSSINARNETQTISNHGKSDEISKEMIKELENVAKMQRKSSFEKAHKVVKEIEKGYSDDRKDVGNWIINSKGKKIFVGTKHGISAPVLKSYLKRTPTQMEMVNLSYETALKIYKKKYWNPQNFDEFCNQSVANILYDGCVNQGITGTRSVLRNSLKDMKIDIEDNENPFDEKYIKISNTLNQKIFFETIKKNRHNRYLEAKTRKHHIHGWEKRLSSIEYEE